MLAPDAYNTLEDSEIVISPSQVARGTSALHINISFQNIRCLLE